MTPFSLLFAVALIVAGAFSTLGCAGDVNRVSGIDTAPFEDGKLKPAPPSEGASPPIRTDQGTYALTATSVEWQTVVRFTYRNPRSHTIYLVNCGGAYQVILEKWVVNRWVPAWGNITPMCLSPAIEIGPGTTYQGVVHVVSGFPGSRYYPQFKFDPEGTYRIVLNPVASFDPDAQPFGPPLPHEQRVSNGFRIRLSPT